MAVMGLSRPERKAPLPQSRPPGHDVWKEGRLHGRLMLRFSTLPGQWVSPGTGLLTPTSGGLLAQGAARRSGAPVLPGTGLKGAVRCVFELLSFSCDPMSRGRCRPGSTCDACSLFGTLGFQGRVSFDDAVPVPGQAEIEGLEKVPLAHGPHGDKTPGEFRFYNLGEARLKNQPLPKVQPREVYRGTFEGRMTFVNLNEIELGRLLLCLGLGPQATRAFPLRVGGVRYDGKGAMEVSPEKLTLVESLGRTQTLEAGECKDRCIEWIGQALASSWGHDFRATLGALTEALGGKSS